MQEHKFKSNELFWFLPIWVDLATEGQHIGA